MEPIIEMRDARLVLNGKTLEDSKAFVLYGDDLPYGYVYEPGDINLFKSCSVVTAGLQLKKLTFPMYFTDESELIYVEPTLVVKPEPHWKFGMQAELQNWALPWTLVDFSEEFRQLSEACPDAEYFLEDDEFLNNGFGLIFRIADTEATVTSTYSLARSVFDGLVLTATKNLQDRKSRDSLVAVFNVPPELRPSAQQYLAYFGQFLSDLGIRSDVGLVEEAGKLLFSVTPQDGKEALIRIRQALDLYLRLPTAPDFDAEASRSSDISALQLTAVVHHLKSQLELAKAVLHLKDATIE